MAFIRSRDLASTASMPTAIFRIEREAEHARIVGDMLRDPEPRAHDYSGDSGTIQDVPNADVGNGRLMLVCDRFQRAEQFLEQCPSSPRIDHVAVLLQ